MPDQATIRIFISSPADVRPERLKAEQIVRRLGREFAYHFHLRAILWEREPLVAAHHFQDPENIPEPHGADIVVVILWTRLGVPLPPERFRGAISGRLVTGTEWEFEDALAGARERGVPDLLLYRKTTSATAMLDDREALNERLAQLDLVADFFARWFRGADDESLSAASHSFAATAEFEQLLYGHLRALLARRAGGAGSDAGIRWHEAPFRALLSYEYEHEQVFFGRTRARNELRELLARQAGRGTAFVLVFGASGSGKSSLVKAGLLPDLAIPGMIGRVGLVRRAVMRPSDAAGGPLDALAGAILSTTALPELAGLRFTPERLASLLRKAPAEALIALEQGLAVAGTKGELAEAAEARLALVVDQLEEIFTIEGLGLEEREAFVTALGALAVSGIVWVIATMRSDFFDRLETVPSLVSLSAGEARFLLLPPNEAEIGQIIREPAQEAGLRFEHDVALGIGLNEEIQRAAARDRDALPLLSFLLDQFWRRRNEAGFLTFGAYWELGGLEGAIGRRAEEVCRAEPGAAQRELVAVLRALVTVQGGTPTARPAPLSLFPVGSPRRALVDALRHPEARLLVNFDPVAERSADGEGSGRGSAGQRDASGAQLRLTHEALLTHWPRAREQVATDARDLGLRDRLEHEAELWRAAPDREKHRRVIAGLMLAEARALRARWGGELPAVIGAFITASRRAARWRLIRLWGMVAAAPVAAAVIALLVWVGLVRSSVRQVEAEWAAEHTLVRIPAGCFEMGSPGSAAGQGVSEGPGHRVCLRSFELGKYDVTEWEWQRVMIYFGNADPSYFRGDRQPVEDVSWDDAQRFLWVMSFFGRRRYRLPTEAEWEYAARAGTTTPYFWGAHAESGCAYAKMADASARQIVVGALRVDCHYHESGTEPVGSLKPNPWGLFDMAGNVFQWVQDCYLDNYQRAAADGAAVGTRDCRYRVIRGGSGYVNPKSLRTASRGDYAQEGRSIYVGFRVAETMTP